MPLTTAIICALLRGEAAPAHWAGWTSAQWAQLAAAAAAHGVSGLLLHQLGSATPAAARAALQRDAYTAAGHNLRLYRALATALREIAPSTPVVVLKGAAVGPQLYPLPSLRPLSDIDILVHAEAAAATVAAVGRTGLAARPHMTPDTTHSLDLHITMASPSYYVAIEVHWSLATPQADRRAAPLAWFWERTEPWQAPDALNNAPPALRLNPTASLLYQSGHLVLQHGRAPARLIWLYDLHLLAQHPALDWADLSAQARIIGWAPPLRAALEEARRCFGTPLPANLATLLPGALALDTPFLGPESTTLLPHSTWHYLRRLHAPARLRALARLALPAPAYLRALYGPRWGSYWPLAYPYRWFKSLRRLADLVAGRPPS